MIASESLTHQSNVALRASDRLIRPSPQESQDSKQSAGDCSAERITT